MRKIGPYLIIGVDDTAELPTPAKLVLDTNVAIDLEHYYFGDRRRIDCDALRQLLLAFPRQDRRDMEVDINYGWALQETAWARDGSFRAPEVRRMAHALRRLVAWLSAADRPMSSTSATGLTICERGRHVRVIYRNSLTGDKACVESHMVTGTLAPVSDLLPNLDALLKQLSGDAAGQRDARALAEAVAQAGSEEDVDTALDAVIAKWRQSS
ncbi:hypothetical protein MAHJHV34_49520 [Mycobacterium avium subsp. hominissuis]